MICASIACGTHKRMIAEHQRLADDGVELVEYRIDFLRRDPDLTRLLKERPTPLVFTARRREDGGQWRHSEEVRQRLLRAAIAEGVDYVDLEEDIAQSIPRYGSTRRIISHHDTKGMPEDLDGLHAAMAKKDADIVKIAAKPSGYADILKMLQLVKNSEVPTIGICMDEIGLASRMLGGKFGAPFTYATFLEERRIAPGMLDYATMRDLYRYDTIDERTEIFGVIASPVGHSLSPHIHNAAFAEAKMNRVYLPLLVPPEDLDTFVKVAPELGISGISVTIPHKVAIMDYLTNRDPAVDAIGACNTVIFDGYERLGYNTDYAAAVIAIEMGFGGRDEEGKSPIDGKSALVLGAGGAGKALAYGLREQGAKVAIADTQDKHAKEVADALEIDVCDWDLRHGLRVNILANCTPVGMHPNVDETPFSKRHLHEGMLVFDAVYNPENTLLLKNARMKGCRVVSGVEMFVGQGCLQFKLFTGQRCSASLMRRVVKQQTSAVRM